MSAIWERSHALEVNVDAAFAWAFMTDVGNWFDPPAEFSLDGPFVDGAVGTTRVDGQVVIAWRVRDLTPGSSYTIEFVLDGAAVRCVWSFTPLGESRCRLAQRIVLSGDNAGAFVDNVAAGFGMNLESGLAKVARAIEDREAIHRQSSSTN